MFSRKFGFLAVALLLGAFAVPSMAQPAPDNGGGNNNNGGGGGGGGGGGRRGGGNGGGGPGGGNFNPQQWRQQQMDQLKTEMGATDEEFAALQPKIEKVQTLEREANPGRMGRGGPGGFGGRRGGNNGDPNAAQATDQPQSAIAKALADLQEAIKNKDTPADTLKAKLDAYRTAKTAAKADLVKAQDDLKSVLTQRQEAVLVTRGTLE